MGNTALKKDRSPPEKASESRKHIFQGLESLKTNDKFKFRERNLIL